MRIFLRLVSVLVLSSIYSTLAAYSHEARLPGAKFTQAVSDDYFYVATGAGGTVPSGKTEYTVSRIGLLNSADSRSGQLTYLPLVPAQARVNNEAEKKTEGGIAYSIPTVSSNPLTGSSIERLGALNTQPLVSFEDSKGTKRVALITDITHGSSLLYNTAEIQDAKNRTSEIHQVTGGIFEGNGIVFASVGDAADSYGIAGLRVMHEGLVPADIQTGAEGGNKAAAIPASMVQIDGDGTVAGITALHWDQSLDRLFVGLSLTDGGVGVLVGTPQRGYTIETVTVGKEVKKIKTPRFGRLILKPILESSTWSDDNFIVARKKETLGTSFAINSLKTIHTSTDRYYLVVNGGVSGDGKTVRVLPLVSYSGKTESPQRDALISEKRGMLAQKSLSAGNAAFTLATAGDTTQLLEAGDAADDKISRVGGGDTPDTVTDMFVVGDAVFISCAGSSSEKQGIFKSTALFDENGLIFNWTAWERVGGAVRKADRAGIHKPTGDLFFLSGDDSAWFTHWGTGSGNSLYGGVDPSKGLINRINKALPSTQGGVHVCACFSGADYSMIDNDVRLFASAGNNKLVLVRTQDESGDPVVGDDYTDPANIQVFDLTSHNIGTITSIALAGSGDSGWLCVGGERGVAVLSLVSGAGWSSKLENLGTATEQIEAGLEFKKLGDATDASKFTKVRKLIASGETLTILTLDGLFKVKLTAGKLKSTAPDPLALRTIARSEQLCGQGESFLSCTVIGDVALLGTTDGLFRTKSGDTHLTDTDDTQWESTVWDELELGVGISTASLSSYGVIADMTYLPAAGSLDSGNLFILTSDISLNVGLVHRFVIAGDTIKQITQRIMRSTSTPLGHRLLTQYGFEEQEYFAALGQPRQYYYTDGAFAYSIASRHHEEIDELDLNKQPELVTLLPLSHKNTELRWQSIRLDLGLGENTPDHTIGKIVREPASGALCVPGIWGLRVQQ